MKFGHLEGVPQLYLKENINHYNHLLYEPGSKLLVLGMVIQPLIGNPYNGYINPYGLGLMFPSPIIYYMEIMGVDRPDRTYEIIQVAPNRSVLCFGILELPPGSFIAPFVPVLWIFQV